MVSAHPYGESQNILTFSSDSKIIVNDAPLKQMFEHKDVKNRKIVAFSIIGAYRRGKSFFLDYCLRFLYANYHSINNPNDKISDANNWMGDGNAPLQGFSWRAGSNRDTTGIMIWNDVFLHTDERSGEKIAIVVLDTQGLFDNETTPMDNSRIFALSTLLSSVQVLNLSTLIQEDQLQYLQFATEFAKFAALDNNDDYGKPFQSLMFLIRDWQSPFEFKNGIEGGEKYLENFLQIKPTQKEELSSVRQFINNSFEKLSCALLPNPGKIVAGGKKGAENYKGNWSEMDDDFKEELKMLIESLLSPSELIRKKINGKELTSAEYREYVDKYFALYQSEDLPKAKSIYETTIEKQMDILINECIDDYKQTLLANQDLITCNEQLPVFHSMCKNKALVRFNDAKKMGNKSHARKFQQQLDDKVEKYFTEWSETAKNNIDKINEEKERVNIALEEKRQLELEQIESKRIAAEKLVELEKENARKEMEHQEIIKQREIAEKELKAEHERKLRIEAEKHSEEQQKLLNQQIEKERLAAQKFAEIEKENARKEIEKIALLKEKALANMRLKAEEERLARMEAEKEKEKMFREKLQAQANEQEWKRKHDTKGAGGPAMICTIL